MEVEITMTAIVGLTESLRSIAAMRHLEDRASTILLPDPVRLVNRLRNLPPELRRLVGKV